MFCDYYNTQQKVYCKRLKVLCPEHTKEPKVSNEKWLMIFNYLFILFLALISMGLIFHWAVVKFSTVFIK